jgi:hypothetical protein
MRRQSVELTVGLTWVAAAGQGRARAVAARPLRRPESVVALQPVRAQPLQAATARWRLR